MANHHTQGRTTSGAADPILDWFQTFETWITTVVGWTMALRVSDTEFFLSSAGEGGGYTKLFVHIWRVGVGNTVRMEVCDDAVPTHTTNEGGFVDSNGVADFYYWMSANLECIIIAWPIGGACRFVYAGALIPYGIAPIDETYHMVATSSHADSSILRNSAGVWDTDRSNYWDAQSDNVTANANCDNFPLFGHFCDNQNVMCGQFWFLSGEIGAAANVAMGDRGTSAIAGATSTWIILKDQLTNKFALWTGGVWPAGIPAGTFSSSSGAAANGPAMVTAIANSIAGWTNHGDPGWPRNMAGDANARLTSNGETIGPLNVTIAWDQSAVRLEIFVMDDIVHTHSTYNGITLDNIWPKNWYSCGDHDCIVASADEATWGNRPVVWGGLLAVGCPDLSDPVNMRLGAATLEQAAATAFLLRNRDGTWTPAGNLWYNDANVRTNTNGNAYDANSYYVNPNFVTWGLLEYVGITKYFGYTNGGGVAWGDTITVGAEVYRVHRYRNTPLYCVMRSV